MRRSKGRASCGGYDGCGCGGGGDGRFYKQRSLVVLLGKVLLLLLLLQALVKLSCSGDDDGLLLNFPLALEPSGVPG